MDTAIAALSGGERRRIAIARLLLEGPELLLLDEPTNHLDVEAVDWLARHLAARRGTLLVVTHDRWFLDAVCTATWEVADETVHQYDGGYAAFVLARAERDRQAAARDDRRRQLLRKELAWLRRGPPARTSKPKFRIDAANELIADEPEVRDKAELLRFATARLGDKVLDAVERRAGVRRRPAAAARPDVAARARRSRRARRRQRLGQDDAARRCWRARCEPDAGEVQRGATVRLARLSQDTAEIPGHLRVLESLEEVKDVATLSDGRQITASMLCDRFGFRGDLARTLVRDLSGGQRRRLQLMRLLMAEPNVLLLDEPTNDLDIETLTALEDLLDRWPGTLVVVSHDRYFVERVCDDVYALTGDGAIRHLPGGIEQYVQSRRDGRGGAGADRRAAGAAPGRRRRPTPRAAARRARRARRSSAWSARSSGSARASASCTRRWRRARPITPACASCRPSSRPAPPSASSSRRRGWRPRRCSRPEARRSGRLCRWSAGAACKQHRCRTGGPGVVAPVRERTRIDDRAVRERQPRCTGTARAGMRCSSSTGTAREPLRYRSITRSMRAAVLHAGGIREEMLRRAGAMAAAGAQVIALLALSDEGAPMYDHGNAAALASLGIPACACTPDLVPPLMAAAIERRDLGVWTGEHDIVTARPAGRWRRRGHGAPEARARHVRAAGRRGLGRDGAR